MKRSLGLLLAALLALCPLAGMAEEGVLQPSNLLTYPLVQEPTEYSWILNSTLSDLNDTPFIQMMEEKTGIHIDWIIVSSADADTRRNLMWASDDLPDVIGTGLFTSADLLNYSGYGILLPLNEYMDEYMPNYTALLAMKGNENARASLTMADGNIYSFPKIGYNFSEALTQVSYNKVWLEKLNLAAPTTLDELFDVLVAIKEGDPNENGEADEIPFAYSYAADWMNGQINAWFGVTQGIMIRDGVVTYSPYEEGWKEMAKFLNRLWEAGLMDPELFTQDNATFKAKGAEGLYGIFQSYMVSNTLSVDLFDDYAYLAPIQTGTELSGSFRSRAPENELSMLQAAISASVENPIPLLQYIDTLYDPYYGSQVANGALGTHLTLDDEGYLVTSDQIPAEYSNFVEWRNATHYQQLPFGLTEDAVSHITRTANENLNYAAQTEFYKPYFINDCLPSNFMLPEENTAISQYTTDIFKYVGENLALWISGERDVEADWDDYRATLDSLHVGEYVAAYQAYVDRVMASMK